ncbi:MAG: patatin-like phospholipase family protein [Methylocapsa sp.]|nr:patatin-like phospholipase family protein [Methylocapsa sp.]
MGQAGQKTAFVFAGGGSLGAIQVGMLRVLLSAGIKPDFVIGTSAGAVNAAFFAGFPDEQGVVKLGALWAGIKRRDIFPFTLAQAFGLLRHPDNIVDSGGLRQLIEANLPYAQLEDAAIPVYIAATSIEGMAVLLSKGAAVDAILASTAIPGIFPPVHIGGQFLMDGAIANNTPILAAANLGASRIVVLPTGIACALKEPPKGVIAKALHAVTLLIAWQVIRDLERIGDEIHVCIVPTLCPLDVSPYDFSASRRLMLRSAASTRKWLRGGGLERRSQPQEFAPHRHRH